MDGMVMKQMKKWWVWLLVVVVVGGSVGWWWSGHRTAGGGAAPYKTVRLERGELVQTVTANGALEAVQTVEVGSEVSGKIMELLADYNSTVTNGQVLAKLDASSYERQLEQSQAELESAQASLKLAQANYRRAQELRALDLVSQADYDQAEASLAQSRAALRMREASLRKVQVDLEKTTIFSPMDGVVISRAVDVGQTVAASLNAPTLFTLAQDLRQMRIAAQISEADVGGVAEGQQVMFSVDAYPALMFSGVVSQVRYMPVTVQNVVNYMAMVEVSNPDLKLRPGMTAHAAVETARREDVLRLPNAALRFRPPDEAVVVDAGADDESNRGARAGRGADRRQGIHGAGPASSESVRTVYVLDDAGVLRAQRVAVGITDGSWTEVVGAGLTEGERIVTGIQQASERSAGAASGGASPFMPRPSRRGMR